MKKSDVLRQELENKKNEAVRVAGKEGVTAEEINAVRGEIETIQAKLEVALMDEARDNQTHNQAQGHRVKNLEEDDEDPEALYEEAFYNALKGKKLTDEQMNVLSEKSNALSTTVGEDGGHLIPEDQKLEIKELKRTMQSFENLVNVEPVSNASGTRTIEKDAEHTPFANLTEGEDMGETDSPQFVPVSYKIKDRGGILPIPNNLLADTKAKIKKYLNKWLAKKQVATRNSIIIALLKTLTKTVIDSVDDIKTILNKTLDTAIAAGAIIVTNQDGFNWLDQLKYPDGKYVMQPDPTDKTKYLVKGKRVVVFSNKTLKNDGTTGNAPIFIGDPKEAVTLFDREQYSVLATQIGGDAFKKNRTDMRAITREDVQLVDDKAVVFGEIAAADLPK